MSSQIRYTPRYSVAEYQQWEGDWELWDGIPVAMSPAPAPIHQLVAANLVRQIGNELEKNDCDCRVLHEIDWWVDDATVVRPDVVVICHGIPEGQLDYSPTLAVEVLSPSTEEKDRTAKFELYASQGVKYYFMVDPNQQTCEAFRLEEEEYRAIEDSSPLGLSLTTNCSIEVVVSQFFD
jgi:Uma2 family endonuclease